MAPDSERADSRRRGGGGSRWENLRDDTVSRIRIEDRSSGHQFVECGSQAVEVGSMIDRKFEGGGLLGTHVARRAEDCSGHAERHVIQPLGQSEIGQPQPDIGIENQVRRFDVAMHDAALVRVSECLGGLQAPVGNFRLMIFDF